MPLRVTFAFVLVLALLGPALAIEFPGFGDTAELQLNGVAAVVETQDGAVLRLTPSLGNRSGSAFSRRTLNARSFSSAFRFRISEPGGTVFDCNEEPGADGIVFVVQPVSSDLGSAGQGIGYAGIPRSVGIEFDTWCNAANKDPNSNHVALNLRGGVVHDALPVAEIAPDFDNGEIWHVWIDYDGALLEVRVGQTPERPERPVVSHALDIPAVLETDTAFVGFTSGTGADWGNHDILDWEYRESFDPIGAEAADPARAAGLLVVRQAEAGALGGVGAILVILDASGSMFKPLDGRFRYEIAKEVLADLVTGTLRGGTPFALRVFGNREAQSCRSDLELSLAPLDPAVVVGFLEGTEPQPFAGTPLAASIAQVASDLEGAVGPKTVVLITDGEESCDGNVEAEIQALQAARIEVVLNIVGFALDAADQEAARARFRAWAALGGGRYFDANSAEELSASLVQAALPADYAVFLGGVQVASGVIDGEPVELSEGSYRVSVGGVEYPVEIVGGQTYQLELPLQAP